jgi:hypothetical protein
VVSNCKVYHKDSSHMNGNYDFLSFLWLLISFHTFVIKDDLNPKKNIFSERSDVQF